MERLHGLPAFGGPLFAVHVQRQTLLEMLFGPDAVDALLCLAEAAVTPQSSGDLEGGFELT